MSVENYLKNMKKSQNTMKKKKNPQTEVKWKPEPEWMLMMGSYSDLIRELVRLHISPPKRIATSSDPIFIAGFRKAINEVILEIQKMQNVWIKKSGITLSRSSLSPWDKAVRMLKAEKKRKQK